MIRVRLFRIGRPVGDILLDDDKPCMSPTNILRDGEIHDISRDLQLGRIKGSIGEYEWYRQATPFVSSYSARLSPLGHAVPETT